MGYFFMSTKANYVEYIDSMLSDRHGVYTSDENESKVLTETEYNYSHYSIFYDTYRNYVISKFVLLEYYL